MRTVFVSSFLVAFALLSANSFAGGTNRVLFVDQDGKVSSTNALATQAELAAVAQSNNLVRAEQAAVADGYNTATQLLTLAAQSITTIPTVYQSVEFVGFEAAIQFSEDAQVYITHVERTAVTATKNDVLCSKVLLNFAFTENLQTVQPFVEYSPQLDGVPRAEWDFLADGFVSAPAAIPGSFTDASGTTYENLYSMEAWVPSEFSSGFFGVWIPNDAVISDGSVMDMPGIRDGFEGTVEWDNIKIQYVGGYAVNASQGE